MEETLVVQVATDESRETMKGGPVGLGRVARSGRGSYLEFDEKQSRRREKSNVNDSLRHRYRSISRLS